MPTVLSQQPVVSGKPLWGIQPENLSVVLTNPDGPREIAIESAWDKLMETGDTGKTASIVSTIQWVMNRLQRSGVVLGSPKEIDEFLLRYPDLIEVVEEVALLARNRFPDAELRLEVYHDPEADDEYLMLLARFPIYDEKTIDRIRELRREYRPLLASRSGWLIFTTDFRQPEEVSGVV